MYYKSTYPRSKIPQELKLKFDLVSDNFNYNDEFWKYNDSKAKGGSRSAQKLSNNSVSRANWGMLTQRFANDFINSFSGSLIQENLNLEDWDKIMQIKSNWIARFIKIKQELNK